MEKLIVKKYYTTGELARFCEVDVNTVKRWIRNGKLDAFPLPSGHLRITRSVLINFLRTCGFIDDAQIEAEEDPD